MTYYPIYPNDPPPANHTLPPDPPSPIDLDALADRIEGTAQTPAGRVVQMTPEDRRTAARILRAADLRLLADLLDFITREGDGLLAEWDRHVYNREHGITTTERIDARMEALRRSVEEQT